MNYIYKDAFFWCPNLSSVTILNSDCHIVNSNTTICNSVSEDDIGQYLGVIKGYEASTAQEFADKYDITFISLGDDPKKVTTTTTTTNTTTTTTITTTTTTVSETSTSTTASTTEPESTESTTTTSQTTTASTTEEPVSSTTTETTPSQPEDNGLGDANEDGKVDAKDASAILAEYAMMSTRGDSTFTDNQRNAADVNKDGKTDAKDASCILAYYAYISTGGLDSMEKWFLPKLR